MRILVLSNFYPPHDIGGYEQWCQEVVARLRGRGHQVAVLTSNHGVGDGLAPQEGVYRRLSLDSDLQHYQPLAFFTRRRQHERSNLRSLEEVRAQVHPELVFVWGMWNLSRLLPAQIEAWGSPPVAYYLSDHWPAEPDAHVAFWSAPARRRLFRWPRGMVAKVALRSLQGRSGLRFDHPICVSRAVKDGLVQAGVPVGHATVIHGGIDVEPFAGPWPERFWERGDGQVRLLYAGGLGAHKGVHTAVQALGLLRAQAPQLDVRLTLAGAGHPTYEAQLRQLALEQGVSERVTFAGRVARSEMPGVYGSHDILVFPSTWEEPLARVPMEAMASGLVVVGTLTGGTGEMLQDGHNGLTFGTENAAGLAGQIGRLLVNPELARQLSEAGRKTVQAGFTLERMVDEIEGYLHCVVREDHP